MVENRPWLDRFAHLVLLLGIAVVAFPIYLAIIAASHDEVRMQIAPVPLLPGSLFFENLKAVIMVGGTSTSNATPVGVMLMNSMIMAIGIAIGKIAISITASYAIVYFKFRFRMLFFWMIFVTLMLPVEVRILPTYEVVASLGLINTYGGLIIPLIASATATFLFRQFFMTVPDELAEAARIDGAGPLRFFRDILLPLSSTTIAALFVIQFIYGWNQYLWPLLITTEERYYTVVMGISRLVAEVDRAPNWNLIMMTSLLAMIPPVLVVVLMQRWFVKGLVETEK